MLKQNEAGERYLARMYTLAPDSCSDTLWPAAFRVKDIVK